MSKESLKLDCCLGYSTLKKNNIGVLTDDVIMYICGNSIQFYNISTKNNINTINGHNNGVGCFGIHPSKKYFCFGEIGNKPDIYIYEYPSLNVVSILHNGTQYKYNDTQFNSNGMYLGSVGGNPDYMLTIWDWKSQTVILRCKAFSQEIFGVKFSPFHSVCLSIYLSIY